MRSFLFSAIFALFAMPCAHAANWPAWRGPRGDGISEETALPTRWSATENVKWRVELPEPGNSTPVIWGNRIFVTQAIGDLRQVMCFSRKDGSLLWQKGVATKHKESTHPANPYCAGSAVTDGERVIAAFASDGLFCYDLDGQAVWKRTDLGPVEHIWGNASSPVIEDELCVLNVGPGETTYLLAVDKRTGKTIWKNDEDTGYGKSRGPNHPVSEAGNSNANPTYIGSWATPVFLEVEGQKQLLMNWPGRLAAYEPRTGRELWFCRGLNPLVYTSPIGGGGIVVAMGGYGGPALAVRAGGSGDITAVRRGWEHPRSPQRIGSGVVYQGHIYIHNDPGTAMCINLESGAIVWQQRLPAKAATGQNWSSVMLSGENCYTVTQGGDCFVFKAAPKFELVSVNPLGERSNSSVVPSNGELFIRTYKALYCISDKR